MITVNNESVEVLIEDKKFDLPFYGLEITVNVMNAE